jgi:hypothetical protein
LPRKSATARARSLGAYLETVPRDEAAQREADYHRQPEVLLREYGAAGSGVFFAAVALFTISVTPALVP